MKAYSLFKVGTTWHYRFQVDGKREQKSTRETVQAKADTVAARAHAAAVLRSRGEEPCPTLRELVVLWLAAHAMTAGQAHLKSLETFGRRHLYDLGDVLLSDLTTARVEEARSRHLLDHARASANHWLACLTLLVHWAVRRHMIREISWSVKRLSVQKKPRRTLPMSSAMKWLEQIDKITTPSMARAIRLAFFVGLRENEAVGARWEWVDWEHHIYTPGKTKGKEAKPRAIPGWLIEALLPHRKPQGLICPGPKGKAYSLGMMAKVMRKANTLTKQVGITPHRLRGTYLTTLSELGVPIQDIQAMAGHADVRTTMAYLETDINRVHRAQDELGKRLGFPRRGSGEPRKPTKARHSLTR